MSPSKRDVEITEEASLKTNFKVLGLMLAVGFAAGGIYYEMRSMRAEVDKMAVQMEEESRQRMQMQADIRELSNLVRGEPTRGGKLSQAGRD